MRVAGGVLAAVLLGSGSAWAAPGEAPRESEADMFGRPAPTASPAPKAATKPAPPSAEAHAQTPPGERPEIRSDAGELNTPRPERDAFASGEVTDNPLQIGGIYYQRAVVSGQSGAGVKNAPLSAPLQFDGFLDARPNDRVRGFVDGRLLYDPTRNQYSQATNGSSGGSLATSSTQTPATSVSSATQPQLTPNNPTVALDQAWLKFDIDRRVFVTAGKQHVKWGTSRFWNPTDLLSTQRRDPLLPYDLRLGNMMAKLELPIEASHTNLYAIGLFDNPVAASSLGQLGSALRAETVIGGAEIGVDAIFRGGLSPVYGADVSTALGPFDVYAEAALATGSPPPDYSISSVPAAGTDLSTVPLIAGSDGPSVQVSGGGNYSFGWRDNRLATVGAEYFYNQLGATSANEYPLLIVQGRFQPFYVGRHYAALYLTAEGPDAEKHTSYTFSELANLSDRSFISRIDFSWRMLTYLTFEAFLDGHYGTPGGEFNFSLATPALAYNGQTIPAIDVPATFFDVGLGLRVAF